jgi:hypothetical protein
MADLDATLRKLSEQLRSHDPVVRRNAARALVDRPPAPELAAQLVDGVAKLESQKVKGDRLEEEQLLLGALVNCGDSPAVARELPRIAARLVEIVGDPDADDDEFHTAREAGELIARFGVPPRHVAALGAVLEDDRIGRTVTERIVRGLARSGGSDAVRALEAEIARARKGLKTWVSIEHLEAAIERARGGRA